MGMAAAVWNVLAKAADLAQMSGLHAAMLVAVLTALLRVQQSNSRECARLERCHRRLRALLGWPASGSGGGVALLLLLPCAGTGDPFGEALADAAGLVDSYKKTTLWRRLWSGSGMATQLRDMQDVVDSYCGLLLFVNAHLLLQQQALHRHHPIPTSPDTSATIPEVNDTSNSPSAIAGTSCPAVAGNLDTGRANDVGQGGRDTDPAGSERNLPALLPIVISHA